MLADENGLNHLGQVVVWVIHLLLDLPAHKFCGMHGTSLIFWEFVNPDKLLAADVVVLCVVVVVLVTKHIIISNGFIFTWILHQIIMYSNQVKLVAG